MGEAVALLMPACAIALFLFPILPAAAAGTLAEGQTRRRSRAVARHAVSARALATCLGIGFSSLTSAAFVALGIAPASSSVVTFRSAILPPPTTTHGCPRNWRWAG